MPAPIFHLFPAWPLLSAFLLASFALAITPGPGVFYILSRSLRDGRRCGLASVAGVALGNLGNAVAAALGLAALFTVAPIAFVVVKSLGAVYLIALGLQALRSASVPTEEARLQRPVGSEGLGRVFRDGVVVALLNPKTTIFFAAFLPQFLGPGSATAVQSIALGGLFVAIAAVTDSGYALAAGAAGPRLAATPGVATFGRYLSGTTLIGLGIFAALSGGAGRSGK